MCFQRQYPKRNFRTDFYYLDLFIVVILCWKLCEDSQTPKKKKHSPWFKTCHIGQRSQCWLRLSISRVPVRDVTHPIWQWLSLKRAWMIRKCWTGQWYLGLSAAMTLNKKILNWPRQVESLHRLPLESCSTAFWDYKKSLTHLRRLSNAFDLRPSLVNESVRTSFGFQTCQKDRRVDWEYLCVVYPWDIFTWCCRGYVSKEWSKRCHQLIIDHHQWCCRVLNTQTKLPCIFGDVEGCIPPGTYNATDPFKLKFHKIANSDFVSHQWCYAHHQMCPLFKTQLDFETAGLPCTDSSRAGNRQFENGPTAGVFVCHGKRHIELATPLILLENVQEWMGLKTVSFCQFWQVYQIVFNNDIYIYIITVLKRV